MWMCADLLFSTYEVITTISLQTSIANTASYHENKEKRPLKSPLLTAEKKAHFDPGKS